MAASVAAAAALGGATTSPAAAASAAASLAPSAVAERSVGLREELGLSAQAGRVARLARDRSAVLDGLEQYGIPMTRAELAEMARREKVSAAAGRLQPRWDDHPEYAGRYVDQRAGGVQYIGYTDNVGAHLRKARAQFRYPSRLRAFEARFSLRQLEETQARIAAAKRRLAAQKVKLSMVSVDARRNRVVVVDSSLGVARKVLTSYGKMVSVEAGAVESTVCESRAKCTPPLLAGLDFQSESDEQLHCSTGFIGYDAASAGALPPSTDLNYFILTAGHCADGAAADDRWRHHDVSLDPPTQNWYRGMDGQSTTSSFDVAVLPIPDELGGCPSFCV